MNELSLCSPPLIETYREGAVCPSHACLYSSQSRTCAIFCGKNWQIGWRTWPDCLPCIRWWMMMMMCSTRWGLSVKEKRKCLTSPVQKLRRGSEI